MPGAFQLRGAIILNHHVRTKRHAVEWLPTLALVGRFETQNSGWWRTEKMAEGIKGGGVMSAWIERRQKLGSTSKLWRFRGPGFAVHRPPTCSSSLSQRQWQCLFRVLLLLVVFHKSFTVDFILRKCLVKRVKRDQEIKWNNSDFKIRNVPWSS